MMASEVTGAPSRGAHAIWSWSSILPLPPVRVFEPHLLRAKLDAEVQLERVRGERHARRALRHAPADERAPLPEPGVRAEPVERVETGEGIPPGLGSLP